ncbi:hypothetical protein B4135_1971 [Caldibacillus debilis]|uniref:Uncharacterized protein n=1 Tax=Caldibacillus debilis TaxID=301148 RepID=A0A150M743_9BACI|nr:hypothetical protein B4135_1971 [Caldibacillus debilis]
MSHIGPDCPIFFNDRFIILTFLFNMENSLSGMGEKMTVITEKISIIAGKTSIIASGAD